MKAFFTCVLFLAGVSGFPKVWKVWIPNTNYDNPSNWLQGRLPTPADGVIFPSDLELGVKLPKGVTTLRRLVLATNGEVFLPNTGSLMISGDKSGSDVLWTRSGAKAWLDPSNWRNDDASVNPDALVPHMERLPCSADTVVFPANSSFRVTLPEVGVPVGTVQLEGGELTNAEWQAWLETETGTRQFIGRFDNRATAVSIKQLPMCPEKSGCVCGQPTGQGSGYLLKVVCGYARRECAEEVPCYSPIRPVGHCCDTCGGYLELEIKQNEQFDIDAMRQLVDKYLKNEDYPGVSGHVGRTSNTHAQIVVVDRPGHYEENSVRLATILAKDIQDGNIPGVVGVTVHTSGHRLLGSRWVAATSTMLGSLFAVVVCMGLVYLLFVVHPSDSRFARLSRFQTIAQPFRFARFENLGGDGEAALRLGSESSVDEPARDPTRQAFDNPLYGQAKDEVSEDKDHKVTHENPVYSELKRKEESKAIGSDDDNDDDSDDDDDGEVETVVEDEFDEVVFGD